MKLSHLNELFVHQLHDLYDAEVQLIDALPRWVDSASHPQLREAFKGHLDETRRQRERLNAIFQHLGLERRDARCVAMGRLIDDVEQAADAAGDADVKDAALIAAVQRIKHYEIAGYGTARTHAKRLESDDVFLLLQETLLEERAADERLTEIAEQHINPAAAGR
ncbi:MAG: ferritin-like domain-containing protein [Planctomycetaceae bacterium]